MWKAQQFASGFMQLQALQKVGVIALRWRIAPLKIQKGMAHGKGGGGVSDVALVGNSAFVVEVVQRRRLPSCDTEAHKKADRYLHTACDMQIRGGGEGE